jgi:hypothetical protein
MLLIMADVCGQKRQRHQNKIMLTRGTHDQWHGIRSYWGHLMRSFGGGRKFSCAPTFALWCWSA